jgi:hypothetical protein
MSHRLLFAVAAAVTGLAVLHAPHAGAMPKCPPGVTPAQANFSCYVHDETNPAAGQCDWASASDVSNWAAIKCRAGGRPQTRAEYDDDVAHQNCLDRNGGDPNHINCS